MSCQQWFARERTSCAGVAMPHGKGNGPAALMQREGVCMANADERVTLNIADSEIIIGGSSPSGFTRPGETTNWSVRQARRRAVRWAATHRATRWAASSTRARPIPMKEEAHVRGVFRLHPLPRWGCMPFERYELVASASYNHVVLQEPAIEPIGEVKDPMFPYSELAKHVGSGEYFQKAAPRFDTPSTKKRKGGSIALRTGITLHADILATQKNVLYCNRASCRRDALVTSNEMGIRVSTYPSPPSTGRAGRKRPDRFRPAPTQDRYSRTAYVTFARVPSRAGSSNRW